jgi:hypothetical protein
MPLSRSPVQSDAFCRSCYGVLEFWFSPPPMILRYLTSSSDPSCHRRRKFLSSTSSPHRRCMARSLFEADSGSARLFHLTQLGSTIVDLAPSARLGLAHPSGSDRLGCYCLGSVSSVVSASPVRLGIVPTLLFDQ